MEPNTKAMDAFELELAEATHQRSQAWRDIRAGKFTASEMWKLMGNPRSKENKEAGKWSDVATTYINTKVAEHITGHINEIRSAEIEWGNDMEPLAKEEFTLITGEVVRYAGFKVFNEHAGGSPDGFVFDHLVEFKCPYNSANHIKYLNLKNGIEIRELFPNYWWQMQANMIFNKIGVCDFAAFDPRFPDKFKMKIVRVEAHPEDQNVMLLRLEKAIEEKMKIIKCITSTLS